LVKSTAAEYNAGLRYVKYTTVEVVVCLMWMVDVLSKSLEILCIIELFKDAKVVIISGT